MVFVKTVKDKAYFKRFQVKYRRRREGRTDYAQRRQLVRQDKNKYNTPKYRLVVRLSNSRIICQIIYATIQGDRVVCQAKSDELPRYGVKVGLKNYSAAYCTGLLIARRMLKQLGMDSAVTGVTKVTGEEYHVSDHFDGERRPFRCHLDIGLVRTTVGARVFGALKGAVDGGLDIPHNTKRFPGYSKADGGKYDAKAHRDRIMGACVGQYMKKLEADDPEAYQKQFSDYIKLGLSGDKIEKMYVDAHAAIRKNPVVEKKTVRKVVLKRKGNRMINEASGKSFVRQKKLNVKQRQNRVMEKMRLAQQRAAAKAEAMEA